MHDAESYEHAGIPVRIVYDEDTEHCDPRDADNLAHMLCWHPNYILGDEQFKAPNGRGAVDRHANYSPLMPNSMEQLKRYIGIVRKGVAILPLYLLDHSGLTISTGTFMSDSAGWDTTMVGFVYTTHERANQLCGEEEKYHTDEWLREQVKLEVSVYDSWLRGEVYGYIVADGSEDEESCWGFVGDIEYVKQEANGLAEAIAKDRFVNTEPPDIAEVLASQ